jgi:cell wall-associated NlpC family hydrolase
MKKLLQLLFTILLVFSGMSAVLNIKAEAASSTQNQIVNIADDYLGVKYVWGGTTPSGFDCSGFTQYVYKKIGVSLPRTANDQYGKGTKITVPSNMNYADTYWKPGDLIFFHTDSYATATHVGIYVSNGVMIHASSVAGKVIMTDLRKYAYHPIGVRRYVN